MEPDSDMVRADRGTMLPSHGDVSVPRDGRFTARKSNASGGRSGAGNRTHTVTVDARTISRPIVCGLVRCFDGICVSSTALLSLYCYSVVNPAYRFEPAIFVLTGLVAAFSCNTMFSMLKLYHFAHLSEIGWALKRMLAGWAGIVLIGLSIAFLTKTSAYFSRIWLVTWFVMVASSLSLGRLVVAKLIESWSASERLARRVAIVGAGPAARRLVEECRAAWNREIHIVGVFDDRQTRIPTELEGVGVLGSIGALIALARTTMIDEIIIALPCSAADRINQLAQRLRELPVDLRLWIDVSMRKLAIRDFEFRAGAPVATLADRPLKHWSAVQKRVEDIALATILLPIAAPLILLLAIAVRLDSRGPAFFKQKRFGFNNQVIEVLKFRTMFIDRCDVSGAAQTRRDDPRVTRLGQFLRCTSLDELPQLFNVVTGAMSFVGPRPHPLEMKAMDQLYHEAVSEYFARHRVRPGITGLAQVSGLRGEIDTMEKARKRVRSRSVLYRTLVSWPRH